MNSLDDGKVFMYDAFMDMKETILKELERVKISDYQICREIGINQAALSRFKSGKKTLNIESAEKLLSFLGYELVKKRELPTLPELKRGRPQKRKLTSHSRAL